MDEEIPLYNNYKYILQIYKYPVEFNSIIPSLNYISLRSFVFYVANESQLT